MNLADLHRRLLRDVLEIGAAHGFVITGGYAVQAHGLVDRFSRDLDVATQSSAQMEAIAAALADQLGARGWQVRKIEADPLSARMMVIDPATGESCEVDVLKEAFYHPPQTTEYGPVLALEDVVGTKEDDVLDLRAWARVWSDDIASRVSEQIIEDDLP